MMNNNVISENDNSTVLAEYTGLNRAATSYQSEAALEKELIKTLVEQGYERLNINSEDELILNLRRQLEKLNNYLFTDGEWDSFFTKVIANKNDYIIEKTRLIQEDYKQEITLDSGEKKNIYLIDKNNIHNNSLQVLNQYVNNEGNFDNRYDVTILVNGLPLVHVELKKRGIDLREAFNQIERY
ncbi:MAG: type I restriction endonuclease, partial [bacterium]|nr:type I restriction endonuclease [bacterium]